MSTFPWNCPAGKLDSEVKARIIRAQNRMFQFQLFCGLNLSQWLFAISDNLSKTMQKESMSALSGLHLAELRIFRKKALDYPFIKKAALLHNRKRPNYGSLNNYFQVEGYSNNANTCYPTALEEYFRQQYFENLDLIISSFKDHFNNLLSWHSYKGSSSC